MKIIKNYTLEEVRLATLKSIFPDMSENNLLKLLDLISESNNPIFKAGGKLQRKK